MRVKTEFQIYEKKHRSGRLSWLVNVGTVNGKRNVPAFKTLEEAESFRAALIEKKALERPSALSDLTTLAAAQVRLALERLEPYGATILDAVDFYVRFAKPQKGKVTISEAVAAFLKDAEHRGLSVTYRTKSKGFFSLFKEHFKDCLISDISTPQAKDYIYGNPNWSAASKNAHIRHIRALYSATIEAKHATLNPFKEVAFVKETGPSAGSKVLTVDGAEKLLDYALEAGRKAECATLVLVLFCGVRMEESNRIAWEEISLDSEKPRVRIEKTKKGLRRVNDIPANAIHWLNACRDKGPVAPANFEKAMQRFRQKAGVEYKQNAARHSFASYHIALNQDGPKTAVMLGHPNPTLLYNTYRECVSSEDGAKFFDIVPKPIREQQAKGKAKKVGKLAIIKQRLTQPRNGQSKRQTPAPASATVLS